MELQGGQFADSQERHLQAPKRSGKSSDILHEGRFVHALESRFQGANRSDIVNAVIKITIC